MRLRTVLFWMVAGIAMAEASTPGSTWAGTIWAQAAASAGVSAQTLYAVALAESQRLWSDLTARPWPWTVNSPQGARRFSSKAEMAAAIVALQTQGVRSIDVGPMQINLWQQRHRIGQRDVFDPATNIRIAAEVLAECRQRFADLPRAIGCYHSPHPDRALAYGRRVLQLRARLLGVAGTPIVLGQGEHLEQGGRHAG